MNESAGESPSGHARPRPVRVDPPQVLTSLRDGVEAFRLAPALSIGFGAIFAIFGVILIALVIGLGFAPMSLPLIGGFMLVAPSLLAGFFAVRRAQRLGAVPRWRDIGAGFRAAPRDLWILLAVCLLIFIIWITDAGILYSFMIGRDEAGWGALFPLSAAVLRFELGAVVAGGFFALIVFCVTAYAVPLLIERRASLVAAVAASVGAVFQSPVTNLLWAAVLAVTIFVAIAIPLLLAVLLPIMAYATDSLYRAVFPVTRPPQP